MPSPPLTGGEIGSSPLTRGKQDGCQVEGVPVRLIPAHAGKTSVKRAATRLAAAHPRSRGENLPWEPPVPGAVGSSPLTRGKLAAQDPYGRETRLIPAHAGKTNPRREVGAVDRAHPRSRGENKPP